MQIIKLDDVLAVSASDILALTETLYGLAVAQVSSQQHVGQEDMATLREAKAEIARAKAVSKTQPRKV